MDYKVKDFQPGTSLVQPLGTGHPQLPDRRLRLPQALR